MSEAGMSILDDDWINRVKAEGQAKPIADSLMNRFQHPPRDMMVMSRLPPMCDNCGCNEGAVHISRHLVCNDCLSKTFDVKAKNESR